MSLHYDDEIVIWTYHIANPDKYRPTPDDMKEFDQDLFDTYEDSLTSILPDFAIALTRRNKSRIVLLAAVSNGTQPGRRVRNACNYFAHATTLDLDEPPNGDIVT